MFGLRLKLTIGFGGLLLILLLIGGLGVEVLTRYTGELNTFLKENGRSVEYGHRITDAVDQIDELVMAKELNATNSSAPISAADTAVDSENKNITLEGEAAIAAELTLSWTQQYRPAVIRLLDSTLNSANRAKATEQLRESSPIVRRLARSVVDLNLSNMRPLEGRAKEMADRARLLMIVGIVSGTLLAVVLTIVVARSVLAPISTVTRSIREVEQGNLDLVISVRSHDELRQLAEAFNSMAAKLRQFRRTDRAKLIRTQQTTQLAINSLPDAVAVTNPDGVIEISNDAAQSLFGLIPGAKLTDVADHRLLDVYNEVMHTEQHSKPRGYESALEVYDAGGQLRFYLPHAVPVADGDISPASATLVLADVTNLRKLDEVKSGLLSVVSHELKTPLTSIRMAVHLLLEERVGPLTQKQAELVTTAREDSDRLDRIIAGLLDMGRLESGRAELDLHLVQPIDLVDQSLQPLRSAFHDKGISIESEIDPNLPLVAVDQTRIGHVLSNLLTNAQKFTDPGGQVSISAQCEGADHVRFAVTDTGTGIPAEYLPRVFDRFFRVPQSAGQITGAGLGLAIAREIVHVHGGNIGVQSQIGQGTTMSFTLCRSTAESLSRVSSHLMDVAS